MVGEEGDLGLEDSGDGEPVEIREPSACLLSDVWPEERVCRRCGFRGLGVFRV